MERRRCWHPVNVTVVVIIAAGWLVCRQRCRPNIERQALSDCNSYVIFPNRLLSFYLVEMSSSSLHCHWQLYMVLLAIYGVYRQYDHEKFGNVIQKFPPSALECLLTPLGHIHIM